MKWTIEKKIRLMQLKSKGYTHKQIADKFGCSEIAVRSWSSKHGIKTSALWSDEEKRHLKELSQDYYLNEIIRRFNKDRIEKRSRKSIIQMLSNLGLKTRCTNSTEFLDRKAFMFLLGISKPTAIKLSKQYKLGKIASNKWLISRDSLKTFLRLNPGIITKFPNYNQALFDSILDRSHN